MYGLVMYIHTYVHLLGYLAGQVVLSSGHSLSKEMVGGLRS